MGWEILSARSDGVSTSPDKYRQLHIEEPTLHCSSALPGVAGPDLYSGVS